MPRHLVQLPVSGTADVKRFFDLAAADYSEQHGHAARLLQYRLRIIRKFARFNQTDRVLEIGCGPGNHLLPLESEFRSGIGTDLSDEMIKKAREAQTAHYPGSAIQFQADDAEYLRTIPNESADLVFCVGAFEHMIQKAVVLKSAYRVLAAGGRFVCLTPNGDYVWYRRLAPKLGLHTTRLSTDEFLGKADLEHLTTKCGFQDFASDYWTFIPGGDMPAALAKSLQALDWVGKLLGIGTFRGGIVFRCAKPQNPEAASGTILPP